MVNINFGIALTPYFMDRQEMRGQGIGRHLCLALMKIGVSPETGGHLAKCAMIEKKHD
jgi:hypothetical protein